MPSFLRKLAGLPRRLLCLPRRSDIDLVDGLPITSGKRSDIASRKNERHTSTTSTENCRASVAAVNGSEAQDIVAERTSISEDVADAQPSGDARHSGSEVKDIAIIRRSSHSSTHCSEDDLQEAPFPRVLAFTQRAIPIHTRNIRSDSPRSGNSSIKNNTKSALRELAQLAARSPSSFVSSWWKDMEEPCVTEARKDPHLLFLIVMDMCAVGSHVVDESVKTESLWADMMLSGVADASTAYLKKYPVAKMRMVTGLTNVVLRLHIASVPPKDVETTRASFMTMFAQYWRSLWENKRFLTEDDVDDIGESASRARDAVHAAISLFFSILWRNKAHYSYWKHSDFVVFRRVMLLVWMHSSDDKLDVEEKESYTVLMSTLFDKFKDTTHFYDDDRRAFVEDDIVTEYGAQRYLVRVCSTYRAFKDVETIATVHDVLARIIAHPDFHPHLVSSGALQAIRDTADVPLAQSSNKDALWFLHKAILAAYSRILNSAPVHQAAKPLLRTYNIFELIARASISFVSVQDTERYNCFCTMREVLAVYTVIAGGAQAHSKKDGLVNTVLQSLRPHWYSTVRDLRRIAEYNTAAAPRCDRVIDVWKALGATLGLREEEEKFEFEKEMKRLEKLCAWKECQYHKIEPPTAASRCMGCREVRYCSRACQQKDWKEGGHKLRCRRLKAEPHSPRSP